jgi:hypothetical protein
MNYSNLGSSVDHYQVTKLPWYVISRCAGRGGASSQRAVRGQGATGLRLAVLAQKTPSLAARWGQWKGWKGDGSRIGDSQGFKKRWQKLLMTFWAFWVSIDGWSRNKGEKNSTSKAPYISLIVQIFTVSWEIVASF